MSPPVSRAAELTAEPPDAASERASQQVEAPSVNTKPTEEPAALLKESSRPGVSSIVKVCVLCVVGFYFGQEVYNIWQVAKAPVAVNGEAFMVSDLDARQPLDLDVYISLKPNLPYPPTGPDVLRIAQFNGVLPAWSQDMHLHEATVNLSIPHSMRKNRGMNLNLLVYALNASDASVVKLASVVVSRNVTLQSQKYPTRLLLESPAPPPKVGSKELKVEPVTGLPRIIEVGFVVEERPLSRASLLDATSPIRDYVSGPAGRERLSLPLACNTLVSPRDEYADVQNDFEIQVRFRSIGLPLFTLQRILLTGFDDAEKMMKINEYDLDSFKQLITGSAPWKFAVVYGVTILHLVFGYLALSADLTYWRKRTSFEGMSARTITLACVSNCISFLYVLELEQSKLAIYMVAAKFLLNLWKLKKLTRLERVDTFPFVAWRNRLGTSQSLEEFEDLDAAEYRCLRNLFLCLLPLIVGFGAYRLIHQEFCSWYSWVILTLAVASQTAGFVIMTPQLFVNYRLKSVDHLPWKALSYQAVNTFIDDIFTLCIRMPEVQKYSVFRDDIVFIICCYQRWLYRGRRSVVPTEKKED